MTAEAIKARPGIRFGGFLTHPQVLLKCGIKSREKASKNIKVITEIHLMKVILVLISDVHLLTQ